MIAERQVVVVGIQHFDVGAEGTFQNEVSRATATGSASFFGVGPAAHKQLGKTGGGAWMRAR